MDPIYTPWPKQREALWLLGFGEEPPPDYQPVNELLFSGEGGGGKSALVRMLMVTAALKWPGSTGCIVRKFSGDLKKTQILPFLAEIDRYNLGYMNHSDSIYHWKNGSMTMFKHCAEHDSHEQFRSYEFSVLAIEESTELPEYQITFIGSRLRSPMRGWYPVTLLTTNPIGISTLYHKMTYVEGRLGGIPWWHLPVDEMGEPIPNLDGSPYRIRRAYIPIKTSDNPSVPLAATKAQQYSITDPDERRAIAEGSWDILRGGLFPEFRRSLHVIEDFPIPKDWPKWRGYDWGFAAPAACVWLARNPDSARPEMYVYRDWMEARVPTPLQARKILQLSQWDGPIKTTLCDPTILTRKRDGSVGLPYGADLEANGLRLTKANNRRPQGWAHINNLLHWDAEHPIPSLRFFESARETIKFVANAQRDPNKPEDCVQPKNPADYNRDDAGDSLRYSLQGSAVAGRRSPHQKTRTWGVTTEPKPSVYKSLSK